MSEPGRSEFSSSLRVTDRGLDFYKNFTHFNPDVLPENAVVINVGGGVEQKFEKELKQIRPDVKIFTLDPSFYSKNADYQDEKSGEIKNQDPEVIKNRITEIVNKEKTVVAYGQQMPFNGNFADVILDVHAASQWAKDLNAYGSFIKEAIRVLKPSGKLHIGNVFFGDPEIENKQDEQITLEKSKNTLKSLGFSDAELFLSQERIMPEYNGMKNVPDNRVCAIITKPQK